MLPTCLIGMGERTSIRPRTIAHAFSARAFHDLVVYVARAVRPSRSAEGSVTWSIIVRDRSRGQFGIAVATRFFAVGALVPHAAAGVGALATQALINPSYGSHGLDLLRAGKSAAETMAMLVAADIGRDHRQLHVMDAQGRVAAHTGAACVEWCGHCAGEGFSVAGNMLVGAGVIEATAAAYRDERSLPLPQRLIAALQAGEAAGGDKRGRQSAALLVQGEEDWPDLDLRVDDHPEPLAELERLERVSRERYVHFLKFLPSRRDPAGITDRGVIEREIAKAVVAAGAQ
jgi:uncharacterized Ntn-hydrolase superfamily protein